MDHLNSSDLANKMWKTPIESIGKQIHINAKVMPFCSFEFWYNALRKNDTDFIRNMFSKLSGLELDLLVNGRFQYGNFTCSEWEHPFFSKPPCKIELPINIAMAAGSTDAMSILIHNGCDLFQHDVGESNVIHQLILASSMKRENNYENIYKCIMGKFDLDEKKRLLLDENAYGLRPLEMAGRLGQFHLQQTIFSTRGVHAFSKGMEGIYEQVCYDVTDYEKCSKDSRREKSPLDALLSISENDVKVPRNQEAINSPLMRTWCNYKSRSNVIWFVMWLFGRLFCNVAFLATSHLLSVGTSLLKDVAVHERVEFVLRNYTNGSALTCDNIESFQDKFENSCKFESVKAYFCGITPLVVLYVVTIVSGILAFLTAVPYVFSFMRSRRKNDKNAAFRCKNSHRFISTRFYSILHFICVCCVSLQGIARIASAFDDNLFTQSAPYLFTVAVALNSWSIMFAAQFVPGIGHFVIIIQRMMHIMGHFLVLYFVFLLAFCVAFRNVLYDLGFCNENMFSQFPQNLYNTFFGDAQSRGYE